MPWEFKPQIPPTGCGCALGIAGLGAAAFLNNTAERINHVYGGKTSPEEILTIGEMYIAYLAAAIGTGIVLIQAGKSIANNCLR